MPSYSFQTSSVTTYSDYLSDPSLQKYQYKSCWTCVYSCNKSCDVCDGTGLTRTTKKFLEQPAHPYGKPFRRPTVPAMEMEKIIGKYNLYKGDVTFSQADMDALYQLAAQDHRPPLDFTLPATMLLFATEDTPAIKLTAAEGSYPTIEYVTWYDASCRELTKDSTHVLICVSEGRCQRKHKGEKKDCDLCLGTQIANKLFEKVHDGEDEEAEKYREKLKTWQKRRYGNGERGKKSRVDSADGKEMRVDNADRKEKRDIKPLLTAENLERVSKEHNERKNRERLAAAPPVLLADLHERVSLPEESVADSTEWRDDSDMCTESGRDDREEDVWCCVAEEISRLEIRERSGWKGKEQYD
jgi:hypothetical protein